MIYQWSGGGKAYGTNKTDGSHELSVRTVCCAGAGWRDSPRHSRSSSDTTLTTTDAIVLSYRYDYYIIASKHCVLGTGILNACLY